MTRSSCYRYAWCLALAGAWLLPGSRLAGQEPAAPPAAPRLPLKKVVLFNSGVGYFEHRAQVAGDAQIELKFNVEDINDLLKSMVLEDQGGGRVSTVSYGSKDPITKTLKTFAIDLTSQPTLADLLTQIRGEQVQVETPQPVEGVIVGVEKRQEKAGEQVIEVSYLTLLTEEGLRSVNLSMVGRIRLLNPQLDAELRQALTLLAQGHATDKKTVTLNFLGEGDRWVRVGYIQEAPLWKTSYRLVLSDEEGQKPFLQGWAIVENTTEEDWQEITLTLVSGRPISFIMNLYDPLYVPRPVVEPELFASLRPQTYGQDLQSANEEFRKLAELGDADQSANDFGMNGLARRPGSGPMSASGGVGGGGVGFDMPMEAAEAFNLAQGVPTVAQAGDVGELFQYVIDTPVTLPRQQSAMLPIVNGEVQAEKLSIYNPNVHAKHPLNGLKLTNTTKLHLMQGPITVFDSGAYAGDAQIEDLPPGSERLISYALDLDTEVAQETKQNPQQLISCKLTKGLLITTHKYQRQLTYTVKNSGQEAKKVLVEYPHDPNWKLLAPEQPQEQTRDLYRFALQADPGVPATLVVEEEQITSQQFALNNLDEGTIHYYQRASVVSLAVKEALAEVLKRKAALQQLLARRQQLEQQLAVIDQEQARIRQNMQQLDRTTELYQRYVKKFGEQEDQVEKLRGQVQELIAQETAQRQELEAYLMGLELE